MRFQKFFVFFIILMITFLPVILREILSENEAMPATAVAAPSDSFAVHLPIIFNRFDPQFPAPLFGMQVYEGYSTNSTMYSYLLDSNTSWVRSRIKWSETEHSNGGAFDWSYADSQLSSARADRGGLHHITVFGYIPEWAQLVPNSENGPIRASYLDEFAEFVHAAVERYDGDGFEDAPGQPVVEHWELFNEPDGDGRWGYYGTEYAMMLQVAFTAIKSANPNAQVVFGGIAYDWFDDVGGPFVESFFSDVLEAGGGDYFDVMNFHMYPLFASVWGDDSTGILGKKADLEATMASFGLTEKPFVITEAGWHNSTDTVPPSSNGMQAARLVQLFTHALAADIKVLIWFVLTDTGGGLPDYGLLTNGTTIEPKLSFYAYQTAVSMFQNAQYSSNLTQSSTSNTFMEAYRFQTPQGPLYTAWMNPYGTSERRTLRVPAKTANVTDPWGNILQSGLQDHDGDNFIDITISSQPVYIQVSN